MKEKLRHTLKIYKNIYSKSLSIIIVEQFSFSRLDVPITVLGLSGCNHPYEKLIRSMLLTFPTEGA